MARFNNKNTPNARPTSGVKLNASAIKTKGSNPTLTTGNGAPAFKRTKKSELFLLAVSNLVSDTGSFYESATDRNRRFVTLVESVVVKDPDWFLKFVGWLRGEAQMRTASIVAAAHGAKAYLDSGKSSEIPYARLFISNACQRADEPGEMLAYCMRLFNRRLPAAVKKGIADAANDLYTEYSLLKYDTNSRAYRFADVINLVHPGPVGLKQQDLFKYALDRRYQDDPEPSPRLTTIRENIALRKNVKLIPSVLLDPEVVAAAGMTWEDVLSLGGQNPDSYTKKELWEVVLPRMGYMATLRNLRNFEAAGLSREARKLVIDRLTSPEAVEKSRQLPFRFYSAYQNTTNLTYQAAIEEGLELSLHNVPELKGKTLILVDMSGSMFYALNENTDMDYADTAKLFGTALALRAESADLYQFGSNVSRVTFRKGGSVLPVLKKFTDMGGTNTFAALRDTYTDHDRVIILTDEQYTVWDDTDYLDTILPENIPLYTWNLAGYRPAQVQSSDYRHTFGGLTDQAFRLIPMIESGLTEGWPWEN